MLAEHPRKGEYVFGFVTAEVLLDAPEGKRQMVTVFVPTNNLYLGDVIVVPRDEVIATGLTVEEGIRIILSAGTGDARRACRARAPERPTPCAAGQPRAHVPHRLAERIQLAEEEVVGAVDEARSRRPGRRAASASSAGRRTVGVPRAAATRTAEPRRRREAPKSSMPSGGAMRQSAAEAARLAATWAATQAPNE